MRSLNAIKIPSFFGLGWVRKGIPNAPRMVSQSSPHRGAPNQVPPTGIETHPQSRDNPGFEPNMAGSNPRNRHPGFCLQVRFVL